VERIAPEVKALYFHKKSSSHEGNANFYLQKALLTGMDSYPAYESTLEGRLKQCQKGIL